MDSMLKFTHVFVGIGGTGGRVVDGVTSDAIRVRINPGLYLLRSEEYGERMRELFSNLPANSIVWVVFEDKPVNEEIAELIVKSVPEGSTPLAYVFTPKRELVAEEKPAWAEGFETVFYDSLWDFLELDVPIQRAYGLAAESISRAFRYLHDSLEGEMLVNVDYADFFATVRGGNVGILRLLRSIDFEWNWGIWDRGIVITLISGGTTLKEAHSVLGRFQELLREKDVIWGVAEGAVEGMEVLALLVKGWGVRGDKGTVLRH
ncbi:hypothetical protein [Thermococcus sp.]|uniref:hypothetical protein n=1 Tax=Thermococcus sp. TaxID=35749 RepID=UPI00345D2404